MCLPGAQGLFVIVFLGLVGMGCSLPQAVTPTDPAVTAWPTTETSTLTVTSSPTVRPSVTPLPSASPTATPLPTSTPTPTPQSQGMFIIGFSVSGRPLEVYQFGSGPSERLIVAGVHGGNEWNTIAR